jgi:TetR/AcrR family transcriptional repressor of nem operon
VTALGEAIEWPATEKGRATKVRILQVAADLILRHGVTGTGLEDVRRAAGVSGSQMTHYFRDRRHLIKDVIAWQAQSTLQQHHAPQLGQLDTFAALRLWADLHIERQVERDCQGGCSFGSLAGQLVESEPDARDDLASGFTEWLELFRHGFTLMKQRGDLTAAADPTSLASALLAAMQGGMLLTQTLRDVAPLRASLDAVLTYISTYATDPAGAAKILKKPRRRPRC